METIAIYWEPVVKVYGFEIREQLSLLTLSCPQDEQTALGSLLTHSQNEGEDFVFTAVAQSDSSTTVHIALKADAGRRVESSLSSLARFNSIHSAELREEVEVLFFHGPHFQDRYGIISRINEALSPGEMTVYAIGCCGTSIYLVLDSGQAIHARELLASNFTVPSS